MLWKSAFLMTDGHFMSRKLSVRKCFVLSSAVVNLPVTPDYSIRTISLKE